jgi:hypothetical protein
MRIRTKPGLAPLLVIAALACAAPAFAESGTSAPGSAQGIRLDVLEQVFAEQKADILAEMEDGRYRKMDRVEKQEVIGVLDRMSRLLEGVESAADMTPEGRVALINHQNLVNILLTKADADQRVVCRRESTVGSNFRTTQCETVADRRARHQRTRHELQQTRNAFNTQRMEEFSGGNR